MSTLPNLFALLTALEQPHFRVAGVCAQTDPELFFPEKGEIDKVRHARQLCEACEVRDACREYAIERGEPFGIWGGTTADERRKIRAARRRAAA
ncbi:MAG: WhiB family transcriptional regulator [Actinophytocola sp.]|nr:WhiB family transcriptional regulator [Actinophytocola sp.]